MYLIGFRYTAVLQFQNYIGRGLLQLFQDFILVLGVDRRRRQELLQGGNLVHPVSSIPVTVARFVHGVPVRVHSRSETAFPPVGTRGIREEVFGRKIKNISVDGV